MTKLLVVDDNEQNRYLLQAILGSHGYAIMLASDGAEALKKAKAEPPDLVVTDILMPGMDGYSLCREWKGDETLKKIPLVFYTATYTDPKDEEFALSLGADCFIVKPQEPEVLLAKIEEVLEAQQSGRMTQPRESELEETAYFKKYNETLIRKLEDKVEELEATNALLEREIAERRRVTDDLVRVNRARAVISECNQALVRITDEVELLREICRLLVTLGGYRLAWVGYAGEEAQKPVRPIVWIGEGPDDDGYVQDLAITWSDEERGRGPVGTCIREQRFVLVQNIETDPCFSPWRAAALKRGYGSVISLPLIWTGHPFGALSIYAPGVNMFNDDEIQLLLELAGDMAYGIMALRTRAEREWALREIETLAKFPDESPSPILRITSEGNLLYANMASNMLLSTWGWEAGHPVSADWRARIAGAFHGTETEEFELECGERVYAFSLTPIASAGYVNVYGRDVTEHKRAEKSLRELSEAVEQANDGIAITDLEGNIHYVNLAWARMHGYGKEELVNKHVSLFHTEEQLRTELVPAMARLLEKGTDMAETEHLRSDGTTFPILMTRTVLRDSNHQAVGIIRVGMDITERKRVEELEIKMMAMDAANKAKSSFLATMSHEIRTPMNGVVGIVDVLRQTRLRPEQAELVEIIHNSAQVLLTIINDILDYSKIEAGKMALELMPLALGELVESVCSALHATALDKGVKLQCFVDPRLPDWILSDSVRLRQILANLIGNAIKFSAGQTRPAWVKVRAECDGVKNVCFTVADNGVGMSPEVVDTLFTPFTQGDGSITRRFGGTGLGLSICKSLVALFKGSIGVKSAPGEGAVFTVTLPMELPETARDAPARPDLRGLTCLVVNDDPDAAADWRAYLEHAGAQATVAGTVQEAADSMAGKMEKPLSVAVINAPQERPDLTALQAVFTDCPRNLRCVLVTAGSHRSVRQENANLIVLSTGIMRRDTLLYAVALAAGRAKPAEEEDDFTPDEIVPPSLEEAKAQGRLILVAEDNDINQKVIRHQLAKMGVACEIAENGQEALRRWRRGKYALLLSDLHMPVMDGYALAAAIRKEEPKGRHMPIIAFTADISKGERDKCMAVGMDGYLTKPAPMERFREMLNKWLPAVKNHVGPIESPAHVEGQMDVCAPSVLDTAVLTGLVGDDPALIDEFLADYLGTISKAAAEIQVAFSEGDWRTVAFITHKLKSSSRSIGAMTLGDCCEKLENAGKVDDGNAVMALMPEFNQLASDVVNAIIHQRSA